MDSTVLVAIIGGCATVAAALVAAWFGRKRREGSTPVEPRMVVKAGGDIQRSVIGSSNVTINETSLGPITQIAIKNLHVQSAVSTGPSSLRPDNDNRVVFLTERAVNYKSYSTGLALSFALRNGHSEDVLIYSITLNLKAFFGESTEQFRQSVSQLSPVSMFNSMIIPVHGAQVRIHPLERGLEVRWGAWDDSAGSRGAAIAGFNPEHYARMVSLITAIASRESSVGDKFELLPPSMRFAQRPGEADAFHLDLRGEIEGIYVVDITIGYHLRNARRTVLSDQQYAFLSIDSMKRLWPR